MENTSPPLSEENAQLKPWETPCLESVEIRIEEMLMTY